MTNIIKCKYCNSRIDINDRKCPNCGADTSDVIEKAIEEQKKEQQEIIDRGFENINRIRKHANKTMIAFSIIVATIIVGISLLMFSKIGNTEGFFSKNITVNYEETAKNNTFEIKCDGIDTYNLVSEFPEETYLNTKREGYQQVAFHIVMTNLTKKKIDFFFDKIEFSLLADGVQMDSSTIENQFGILKEEDSKSFEKLGDSISPNATIKGWIGFYVDVNAKELKLKVKNITIKMDNPVYAQ